MMLAGARGTIHLRDLEAGGVYALDIDGQAVCFDCITDKELTGADLKNAILDMYLDYHEGESCGRCNRSFFTSIDHSSGMGRRVATADSRSEKRLSFNARMLNELRSMEKTTWAKLANADTRLASDFLEGFAYSVAKWEEDDAEASREYQAFQKALRHFYDEWQGYLG